MCTHSDPYAIISSSWWRCASFVARPLNSSRSPFPSPSFSREARSSSFSIMTNSHPWSPARTVKKPVCAPERNWFSPYIWPATTVQRTFGGTSSDVTSAEPRTTWYRFPCASEFMPTMIWFGAKVRAPPRSTASSNTGSRCGLSLLNRDDCIPRCRERFLAASIAMAVKSPSDFAQMLAVGNTNLRVWMLCLPNPRAVAS
mmetsp:Transcript_15029/g.36362  ORF Transcript_15029/g.36362 Transcript_15029/m.36362 type:complete len:200 (-) Transcript_15029:183-782(-)